VFIIITITIIKTKDRARRGKQSVLTGHRGATHSFIRSFTYRSIKR